MCRCVTTFSIHSFAEVSLIETSNYFINTNVVLYPFYLKTSRRTYTIEVQYVHVRSLLNIH